MKITLPTKIQSQNKRDKLHWATRSKQRQHWYTQLRMRLKPKEPPTALVSIRIVSYRNRLLDYANLVGGDCKPIIDCLVQLGYIKDDSPRWFTCEYQQVQVARNEERTEIVLPS